MTSLPLYLLVLYIFGFTTTFFFPDEWDPWYKKLLYMTLCTICVFYLCFKAFEPL